MKTNLRHWYGAAMGTVFALALGSCVYDPNYGVGGAYSAGYGGGYGYGAGYGYGGSGFSTSLFVSTGDPRWGYDPYCYSYYDYYRHCYYDPYLYGYYPVGYRPLLVVGVPHPYGYSHSFCPPPSRVRTVTLSNYSNREAAYRRTSYSWAHQVHQQNGNFKSQQPQQRPVPYAHNGNANYTGNRYPSQLQAGQPQTRTTNAYTNPALHRQQGGQPANYNGPPKTNPQGNGARAANYQGGTRVRAGGPQPQAQPKQQHPGAAAANKGRGEGKDDREGGGRSGR